MIQLNDYRELPKALVIGKPNCFKALDYRFNYQGEDYLVEVEIDFENVPLITLYELDDNTVKYVGDSGENLYFLNRKTKISEEQLIDHCNEYLNSIIDIAFRL